MNELVAYDAANPPVAALCESSATLICCYTDGLFSYAPDTVQAFVEAGKGILANHENAQNELTLGFDAGVAAAYKAMNAVKDWPIKPPCIYYSADLDLDPSSKEYDAVLQAFDGINQTQNGEYQASCYGQGSLLHDLTVNHLIQTKGWLSSSTAYPGYDRQSPFVGMYQLVGSDIPNTDKNIITDLGSLGVWLPQSPRKGKEMSFHANNGDANAYATYVINDGWTTIIQCASPTDELAAQAAVKAGGMYEIGTITQGQIDDIKACMTKLQVAPFSGTFTATP